MNESEKMDERNDWLLNLYDGTREMRPPTDPPTDPEFAREAESLREMKTLLDALPARRPDATTVSAVLAAARGEAVPMGARRDRAPARRQRNVALRVGAVSAVLVALIAIVGILKVDTESPDAGPSESTTAVDMPRADRSGSADEADRASQNLSGRMPSADRSTAEGLTRPGGNPDSAAELTLVDSAPDPALLWDERDDVIDLHQRIERIGSGVDREWDAPPIPLEMLPAGQGTGIIPVGQQR